MTITFYQNASEERVVNKDLTEITTLMGTLREGCDVGSPSILIQGDLTTLASVNYMYIPEFSRYYYIEPPRIESNNLYTITGRVDVLMSNKEDILRQGAIVKKQTYKNNTWLNDGTFKVYQNTETVTKKFPYSFSGTTYVLMISG